MKILLEITSVLTYVFMVLFSTSMICFMIFDAIGIMYVPGLMKSFAQVTFVGLAFLITSTFALYVGKLNLEQ